jgi:hypothetical protein
MVAPQGTHRCNTIAIARRSHGNDLHDTEH